MNRRNVLRAAGVGTALALAGCVERLESLGFSMPVLVTIENETDTGRSVAITAYDLNNDRGTYDEAVFAPADQTTDLGRLSNTDQLVRVALFEPYVDVDDIGGPGSNTGGSNEGDGTTTSDDHAGSDGDNGIEDDGKDTDGDDSDGDDTDVYVDEFDDEDVTVVEETFVGERSQQITAHITADGLELEVRSRD